MILNNGYVRDHYILYIILQIFGQWSNINSVGGEIQITNIDQNDTTKIIYYFQLLFIYETNKKHIYLYSNVFITY